MARHRRLAIESLERRELLSANPLLPQEPTLSTTAVQSFELIGDLDGDRRADVAILSVDPDRGVDVTTLLSQGRGQLWRTASQRLSSGPTTLAFPPALADLDGDGRQDLLFVKNGPTAGTVTIETAFLTAPLLWTTSTFLAARPSGGVTHQLVGDVDGDRQEDLVFLTAGIRGVSVTTLFSQGRGQPFRTALQPLSSGSTTLAFPPTLTDLDGDGREDLLLVKNGPTARTVTIETAFQTGPQFWTTSTFLAARPSGGVSHQLVGDVDGDGQTDLVFLTVGSRGVRTTTLFNQGRSQPWRALTQQLISGPTVLAFPPALPDLDGDGRTMPDLDGDGRDDLLFVRNGPTRRTMTIVTGFQTTAPFWTTSAFVTSRQPLGAHELVGDVNGDGQADLVFLAANANGVRATTLLNQGRARPWFTTSQRLRAGPSALAFPPVLADVDDDGRQDLLFLEDGPAQGAMTIVTAFHLAPLFWTTTAQIVPPAQTFFGSSTATSELTSLRKGVVTFHGLSISPLFFP